MAVFSNNSRRSNSRSRNQHSLFSFGPKPQPRTPRERPQISQREAIAYELGRSQTQTPTQVQYIDPDYLEDLTIFETNRAQSSGGAIESALFRYYPEDARIDHWGSWKPTLFPEKRPYALLQGIVDVILDWPHGEEETTHPEQEFPSSISINSAGWVFELEDSGEFGWFQKHHNGRVQYFWNAHPSPYLLRNLEANHTRVYYR